MSCPHAIATASATSMQGNCRALLPSPFPPMANHCMRTSADKPPPVADPINGVARRDETCQLLLAGRKPSLLTQQTLERLDIFIVGNFQVNHPVTMLKQV